jgi:hypothetical protein
MKGISTKSIYSNSDHLPFSNHFKCFHLRKDGVLKIIDLM